MHSALRSVLALCAASLVFTSPYAISQAAHTGELRLRVHDTAGHALHATGSIAGPNGAQPRPVETESDGSLTVTGLPYGRYTLSLQQQGFAAQTLSFVLQTPTMPVRDVVLSIEGLRTIVGVSATPIGPADIPLSDVPVPVQTLSSRTIDDTNALDLTDALKRRLNGVYVNENQDNPFQPDVNYRGYTASPLVGAPAGLSVYMDGVRQNQPFGDVVQWDLIPKIAIDTTELIPGSNPVYGLNTLGGAIALQTKSGISDAGFRVSGYGGAFGRRAVDMEYGDSRGAWNWYAAGTLFHEDGWRDYSPSSVKQSFAKVGYNSGSTVISLSGGYAINNLTGNGTQDIRAINRTTGINHGYASVYTIPDVTYQHQPFVTLNVTQVINRNITFNLNSYVRYTRTNTSNGDANDDAFDQSLYTLSAGDKTALLGVGYSAAIVNAPSSAANTPFPYLRCIAQVLEKSEPAEKCTGVDTDTVTRQHAYGVSGVLSWNTAHNKLSVGAGFDQGGVTFVQNSQYGYINTDGVSVTRVNWFEDGREIDDDGSPYDDRVNLHGKTTTPSFFATDTLSWQKFVINVGGRYNHTDINNTDRLPFASYRGTLTADNQYQRFNPTAGFVYKPIRALNAYFDYSESSRAPTSTELGCSDPNFPCSLPNALVSDPHLNQVVSRTFEFGVRHPDGKLRWNAGYFHSNNDNDLLFVSSQVTGFGYFQNFGQTRRQGIEASISTHLKNLDVGADYTFLSATYQSSQTIASGANSTNTNATSGGKGIDDGGNITIVPGDRIPEVPQHITKLFADYRPLKKLSISADLNAISSSYVRGNENNLHQPDGVYYLGPGKSPAYGVVNVGTHYTLTKHLQLFAEINNLFNTHYYTGGQLNDSPYDDNGNFIARPFAGIQFQGDTAFPLRNTTYLAPGAPITVFGGLKVSLGKR